MLSKTRLLHICPCSVGSSLLARMQTRELGHQVPEFLILRLASCSTWRRCNFKCWLVACVFSAAMAQFFPQGNRHIICCKLVLLASLSFLMNRSRMKWWNSEPWLLTSMNVYYSSHYTMVGIPSGRAHSRGYTGTGGRRGATLHYTLRKYLSYCTTC